MTEYPIEVDEAVAVYVSSAKHEPVEIDSLGAAFRSGIGWANENIMREEALIKAEGLREAADFFKGSPTYKFLHRLADSVIFEACGVED